MQVFKRGRRPRSKLEKNLDPGSSIELLQRPDCEGNEPFARHDYIWTFTINFCDVFS